MKVLLTKDRGLEVAYDKFREFTRNDEYRYAALAREKAERDYRAEMNYARKQGLAEGALQGTAASVVRLLHLKFFDALTPEMEEKIYQISDAAKLDELLTASVQAQNLGDLAVWF